MELEQRIKRSVVIKNHDTPADRVDIGRLVTIRETGFDDTEIYFIVGRRGQPEQWTHLQRVADG